MEKRKWLVTSNNVGQQNKMVKRISAEEETVQLQILRVNNQAQNLQIVHSPWKLYFAPQKSLTSWLAFKVWKYRGNNMNFTTNEVTVS
jgi:hypothetical protein